MAVAKTHIIKPGYRRYGPRSQTNLGAHVSSRMIACSKVVTPDEQRKRMPTVGQKLRPFAWKGASRDVGSKRHFSGWRRGAGIKFNVDWKVHRESVGLTIHRSRESAGPWRVAEIGRHIGETGLFLGPAMNHRTGMTSRNKRTGNLIIRKKTKRKRWNGYTKGKQTFSHASDLMAEQAPRFIRNAETRAIGKAFLGK